MKVEAREFVGRETKRCMFPQVIDDTNNMWSENFEKHQWESNMDRSV